MQKVNPTLIVALAQVVAPLNDPRDSRDPKHIERMASRLRAGGELPAIHVVKREDKFEVIFGETRRLAYLKAGRTEIEVVVRDNPLSDAELLLERLLENEWREDFNPIERARIYLELMKLNGWSQAELAEHVGESPSYVNRTIQISKKLISALQDKVASGELGPSFAGLLKDLTPEQQADLGPRVIKENWKRERLEREVKKLLGKRVRKRKPVKITEGDTTLIVPGDTDADSVIESLKVIIKRLKRSDPKDGDAPVLLPV